MAIGFFQFQPGYGAPADHQTTAETGQRFSGSPLKAAARPERPSFEQIIGTYLGQSDMTSANDTPSSPTSGDLQNTGIAVNSATSALSNQTEAAAASVSALQMEFDFGETGETTAGAALQVPVDILKNMDREPMAGPGFEPESETEDSSFDPESPLNTAMIAGLVARALKDIASQQQPDVAQNSHYAILTEKDLQNVVFAARNSEEFKAVYQQWLQSGGAEWLAVTPKDQNELALLRPEGEPLQATVNPVLLATNTDESGELISLKPALQWTHQGGTYVVALSSDSENEWKVNLTGAAFEQSHPQANKPAGKAPIVFVPLVKEGQTIETMNLPSELKELGLQFIAVESADERTVGERSPVTQLAEETFPMPMDEKTQAAIRSIRELLKEWQQSVKQAFAEAHPSEEPALLEPVFKTLKKETANGNKPSAPGAEVSGKTEQPVSDAKPLADTLKQANSPQHPTPADPAELTADAKGSREKTVKPSEEMSQSDDSIRAHKNFDPEIAVHSQTRRPVKSEAFGAIASRQTERLAEQQQQRDLFQHIQRQMKMQLKPDSANMQIRLKPESLGQILVKMELNNGNLNANIWVESVTVKHLFEKNIDQLKETLLDKGIKAETVEIRLNASSPQVEKQTPGERPWNQARDERKKHSGEERQFNRKKQPGTPESDFDELLRV